MCQSSPESCWIKTYEYSTAAPSSYCVSIMNLFTQANRFRIRHNSLPPPPFLEDNLPYVAFSGHTALSENASPPGHKMSPNWPICFVAVNPAHHQFWAYSKEVTVWRGIISSLYTIERLLISSPPSKGHLAVQKTCFSCVILLF